MVASVRRLRAVSEWLMVRAPGAGPDEPGPTARSPAEEPVGVARHILPARLSIRSAPAASQAERAITKLLYSG